MIEITTLKQGYEYRIHEAKNGSITIKQSYELRIEESQNEVNRLML